MALLVGCDVTLGEVTGEVDGVAVGVDGLEGLNFRVPEKISTDGIRIIAINMTAKIANNFFRAFRDVCGGGGGGGKFMLSIIFLKSIFNIYYILFGINCWNVYNFFFKLCERIVYITKKLLPEDSCYITA